MELRDVVSGFPLPKKDLAALRPGYESAELYWHHSSYHSSASVGETKGNSLVRLITVFDGAIHFDFPSEVKEKLHNYSEQKKVAWQDLSKLFIVSCKNIFPHFATI